MEAFRVLLVTPIPKIYARLTAALVRRHPSASERRTDSGLITLALGPESGVAIAMLTRGEDISSLVAEIQANAVLSVVLGATAAPDAAAVGDVLVPAIVHRARDDSDLRASGAVLEAARKLAHEPWGKQLDERRPGRDDERPAIRFGNALAVDRLIDRPLVRARGLGIVHDDASAFGAQLDPDIAFGLVVGISDDASVKKRDAWQKYACAVVSEFAVALAAALRPTTVPASLFPQRELPAGTQLYRVNRAGHNPLAQTPIFFATTAASALAEILIPLRRAEPLPRAQVENLQLVQFALRSVLHLADLAVPSARLTGIDFSSGEHFDERPLQAVLDAGLDGWILSSRLSADPAWDRVALARGNKPLLQVEGAQPVTNTVTALESDDPVAQLLRATLLER